MQVRSLFAREKRARLRSYCKESSSQIILLELHPLTVVEFLIQNYDFASVISVLLVFTLIVFAELVGIIPESGPCMFFLILYSKRLKPFSVL